ncbi:MAG: hypothetical protein LBS80_05145 [Tannerella sp.]|jgi:hypothetical protein|nr:hypothetical protein [Tannerella sp.]
MAQNKKRKKTPAQKPTDNRKRVVNKSYADKAYAAIKKMIRTYGLDPDIFDQLTKNQRSVFLLSEIQAPKFKVAEGYHVPRQLVTFLNSSALHFMRENYYGDRSIGLSYLELVTFCSMFYTQINSIHHSRLFPPTQMLIIDAIAEKFAETTLDKLLIEIGLHFRKIVQMITKVNFRIYGYDWELSSMSADGVLKSLLTLYSAECESVYFTYRSQRHKAFRVMCCGQAGSKDGNDKFYCATIDQWLITGKEIDKDESIDIYIQSHALQRIKERVDIFPAHKRNFYVMDPLLYLHEVVYGTKDRIMFECYYKDVLFGYYPFEVQGDKLFVLSFLPILSPDTPKGMILTERLKLRKDDMIHLGMDKLSFFFTVDCKQIPVLYDALLEIGLGPLLNYKSEDLLPFEYDEKKTIRVKNFFEKNELIFKNNAKVPSEINIKRKGVVNTIKRKRPDTLQEKKLQKARTKSEFMDKIKMVCKVLGDESMYDKMPDALRFEIYIRRSTVEVKVAKGVKIQKRLFDLLNELIAERLPVTKMELIRGSGQMISMEDYINVVFSMESALDKEYPVDKFNGIEFFDGMVAETERHRTEFDETLQELANLACTLLDDPFQERLNTYALGYETHLAKAQSVLASHTKRRLTPQVMEDLDFKMYHTVTLGSYPLRSRLVTSGDATLMVVQLAEILYPDYEKGVFNPVMIRGKALKKFSFSRKFSNLEIPVYISEDAFNHLMARSAHILHGFCNMDLVSSFTKPVSRLTGLNKYMIDFLMGGMKIGYLIASVSHEGILVITDFLLMTDKTTFEGNMLHRLVRRKKYGAEYAAIDSLLDLADTDILQNEAVSKLFHDSGCQALLEICTRLNEDENTRWTVCVGANDEMNVNDLNLDADKDEFIEG